MPDTTDKFINIPTELRGLPRWVCWMWAERDGKQTKVPINANTGGNAMPDTPSTWATFSAAIEHMKRQQLPGIGFMFGAGYVGIDIDGCRDPETGSLNEVASDIIGMLDSYTEISVSGKGIHVICKGKLPEGRRRREHVEMYDSGRYFCMTGKVVDDAHTDIEERSAELAAVHEKYLNVKKPLKNDKKSSKNVQKSPDFMNDDDLIERIKKGKNSSKIMHLLNGNWQGMYTSHSEADIALMNYLAYYSDKDYQLSWSTFMQCGLFRSDDFERNPKKYTGTMEKAISECAESYSEQRERMRAERGKGKQLSFSEQDMGLDQLIEDTDRQKLPDWITGPYNDTWNTQRLIDKQNGIIRYNPSRGWYVWNSKYWELDELNKVRAMADKSIEDLYQYKETMYCKYGIDEDKKEKRYTNFVSWIGKARNTNRKDNMIREAESWENIRTLPRQFDVDKCIVNLENGIMDMEKMEFLPHDSKRLITKIMPVNYDPYAKAEL